MDANDLEEVKKLCQGEVGKIHKEVKVSIEDLRKSIGELTTSVPDYPMSRVKIETLLKEVHNADSLVPWNPTWHRPQRPSKLWGPKTPELPPSNY